MQDVFFKKLKQYRKTEHFRRTSTKGGFYSVADMRKPISEGGLAYKESLNSHHMALACACVYDVMCGHMCV